MSDRRVYDAYIANRQSSVLAVAVHLGWFAGGTFPISAAALSARDGLSLRGTEAMLVALRGMELLTVDGDVYDVTEAAAPLDPASFGSLAGLIALEMDHYLTPAGLLEAVRSGKPAVYEQNDAWERHAEDAEAAAAFTAGMHAISQRPARALWQTVDLSEASHLLDIAGGSGVFVAEALARYPQLRGTVLDLATVCETASATLAPHGDRGAAVPRDMFAGGWPAADVVLLSQILHDWPMGTDLDLLRHAYDALPAGGRVLVHEKLVETDGGPLANALVTIDMLVWTDGQQLGVEAVRALLAEAGFTDIEVRPTVGYWSVVIGVRPG